MIARAISCILGISLIIYLISIYFPEVIKPKGEIAFHKGDELCTGRSNNSRLTQFNPQKASPRGNGTISIYVDDTSSMKGFVTAENSQFPRIIRALDARLATFDSKIFPYRFDERSTQISQGEFLSIPNSDGRFFSVPGSSKPTRIDLVVNEVMSNRDNNISAIVTDLYQSYENGASGGTEILQKKLLESLKNMNAVSLIGIRIPFKGAVYDLLERYKPSVDFPSGSSRLLYVILVGRPETVDAAASRLSADFSDSRLEHHTLRVVPLPPDRPLPPVDVRIAEPQGHLPVKVKAELPCPEVAINGHLAEGLRAGMNKPVIPRDVVLQEMRATGTRVILPDPASVPQAGDGAVQKVAIDDALISRFDRSGDITLFPVPEPGLPNPFLSVAPPQQPMLIQIDFTATFGLRPTSVHGDDWPADWSYWLAEEERTAVQKARAGNFFPTLGLSGLLAALRQSADATPLSRSSDATLAFLLNIESKN